MSDILDDDRPAWGYAYKPDAEEWYGAHSRDEAEGGAEDSARDSDDGVAWITEGRYLSPSKVAVLTVDPSDFLARMEEMAFDNNATWDDELFTAKPEASEALEQAIAAWAREYVTAPRWMAVGAPIEVRICIEPDATDGSAEPDRCGERIVDGACPKHGVVA